MKKEKMSLKLCDYNSYVIRLLKIMGVDDNDVEDLAEDVFVAAFNNIESLRNEDKLKPWIKTIASNRAKKYFSNKGRHKEISNMLKVEAGEMNIYDLVADEATVEKILQKAEEDAILEDLLHRLPDVSRRILRMRFWGDYKFHEIADIMDLNVNTVKTVYRRSIKILESRYEEVLGEVCS